jgi:hypothetical protein
MTGHGSPRPLRLVPIFVGLGLLASAGVALSRPKIREAFFAAHPTAVGTRLDDLPSNGGHCGVCHYDFNGGGARNPYGLRVQQVINQSPPCNGNDVDCMKTRMLGIGGEDSDGDGYSQSVEITATSPYTNTPTFPGLTAANVGSVTNVLLADIAGFLVPTTGADTQPPVVTVTAPDGGESWVAGTASHAVTWTATDNVGVVAVDVYFRDGETEPWTPLALGLPNSGSLAWFVPNLPTASARVRVVARDAMGNSGEDLSDGVFTIVRQPGGIVATTLRDFFQPGTQPFGGGTFETSSACLTCHGGYDPAVEPGAAFQGTLMAQAARDPLFYACLAIAEQDAPSSGDLCIRCHSPFAWLQGRSQPTDGSQITAADRDAVSCDFCHRAVDPVYKPGVSPVEDQAILAGMLPAHVPTGYSNGQFVIDPQPRKRGPFSDAAAPHAFLASAFHRSSDLCGTCHDVSNPVFDRVGTGADYAPGPLDQAGGAIASHTHMPLERTYSEWKHSAFPAGVFAPDFAGNRPDGTVSSCQDCHQRDVSGRGCNDAGAPVRADLPYHDLTGGNAWLGPVIASLYPGETNAAALADAAGRAEAMLRKAALIDVQVTPGSGNWVATVSVTNRTGHKLPTGYPEGRRMWLHVLAYDSQGNLLRESGAYDAATGVLTRDADATVYEAELGISPALGAAIGLEAGPTFHFALNDTVYKDNRIPPQGFTNAAFAGFGGAPVDPDRPAPRYADGQNWDVATYAVPAATQKVVARLYYQTTSKEYVEFLHARNTTNDAGQVMLDAWNANSKSPPVLMAADSSYSTVAVTPPGEPGAVSLEAARNPFVGTLELHLTLVRPEPVTLEVFDAGGRSLHTRRYGTLGAGAHRLTWAGPGDGARAATLWARVRIGEQVLVRQVARLR